MMRSNPDVFLFGKAYQTNNTSGSMSQKMMDHLFFQFTNAAAKSRPLIFYLFDRMQRFSTIRNLSGKVKSDKRAFEAFTRTFMSSDFQSKLSDAVAKPNGENAKYVLRKLILVLSCGAKNTVFGALERRTAAGEILAIARKHGGGGTFITISIDDKSHPNVLRLAFRSTSNYDFPAMASDDLLKALENGDSFPCQGSGLINLSRSLLATIATKNPISVAIHYKNVINAIVRILIGIKTGGVCGNNNRSVATVYKDWSTNSLSAIMGTATAFQGVTEATQHGNLHFHVGKTKL